MQHGTAGAAVRRPDAEVQLARRGAAVSAARPDVRAAAHPVRTLLHVQLRAHRCTDNVIIVSIDAAGGVGGAVKMTGFVFGCIQSE